MRTHKRPSPGFTIVELLIVIVVIAILAAISVAAFNGIQDRAIASTVKSDLANFAKKMEIARVDTGDGGYPATPTTSMGIAVTKSAYTSDRYNWYYCASSDHTGYALGVVDAKNRGYWLLSASGVQENINSGAIGASQSCAKVGATTGYNIGYNLDASGNGSWRDWAN